MLDIAGLAALERFWQSHNDDRLTRSLILDGYEAAVIEAGLVYFIDQWEEAVAWRQRAYGVGAQPRDEEYRYYLFCRSELDWAVRQVSTAQQKKFSGRITRADRAFRKTLQKVDEPFCFFPEFIDIPEPKRNWWLFSVPKPQLLEHPSSPQEPPAWLSMRTR